MTVSAPGKSLPIGAIVGGLGGVVAIIGAFMAWESVSASLLSESISGWSGGNGGKIIAVLGLVAIAVAVAWIIGIKIPQPAGLMVVAGVLLLLVGVANYFAVSDDISMVNAMVPGAASIGIGLYLDLLAGVVIIVGGALGLTAKKS
jgi:hypothetical protein